MTPLFTFLLTSFPSPLFIWIRNKRCSTSKKKKAAATFKEQQKVRRGTPLLAPSFPPSAPSSPPPSLSRTFSFFTHPTLLSH